MSHHIWSICIFCLCSTISTCCAHSVSHNSKAKNENITNIQNSSSIDHVSNFAKVKSESSLIEASKLNDSNSNDENPIIENNKKNQLLNSLSTDINQRSSNVKLTKEVYLSKIFHMFGDGKTMTVDGFEKFLERLDLLQILSTKLDNVRHPEGDCEYKNDVKCMNHTDMLFELGQLNKTEKNYRINNTVFEEVCPAIVYSLMSSTHCNEETHVHNDESNCKEHMSSLVWVYSTLSVILTSACGVLALIIIPVMQKKFYQPLLQFLVALAVGTLAGDALLHLLPHAMTKAHSHGLHANYHEVHVVEEGIHSHDENTWKGFVAMMGLTFFFVMERLILLAGKWRKGKHKKQEEHSHTKFCPQGLYDINNSNLTQCMDRYNPYPYCYQDILNHQIHGCPIESDKTASTMIEDADMSDEPTFKKTKSKEMEEAQNNGVENSILSSTETNKMLPDRVQKNENITIILREHGSSHHGHSHSHGHVHAAPQNFSSVAWMVIMGDGLHNFTDGMAIGAAFSGSFAGGFSTAVAVFCHELPHELGDFAMLLKAGMTIKQALFYNLLASVLSILGNIVGICLGNTEYASSWVFAAAAGMFIYIALVDMIPELSSSHEDENSISQCFLHLSGLIVGFGIMTFIAMYEQDLKSIFKDPGPTY